MILSYVDILGNGERHNIKATITTEHSLSSYGQPVLLLEDGKPLNAESWFLMAYQVVKATPEEFELLKQWVSLMSIWLDSAPARALGRLGGQVTSDAKTKANRAKSNLPPKEGKRKRGRPAGSKNKPKGNDAH